MSDLSYPESVVVACPPETLYELVSDVTRMGEWSLICKARWWDRGEGPRAGAWFTGRNCGSSECPAPIVPGQRAPETGLGAAGRAACSAAAVMLRSIPPNTMPWNGEIDRQ